MNAQDRETEQPGSASYRVLLASRIAKELKKAKKCGIYEPELSRAWPPTGTSREAEIAHFAKRFGWRLRYYKEGFCAIFDND